ncbi:putative transcription factor interactor and regulator CCHC(Zn) family [Lupinus albus]|uniref:Putative transcription factor interactor and regulator CCHC(Zn) family n=1 Tax=Lupinus albus TaxID=3870 RepID=A0A6A4NJC8_LUPAL|nr:putative transcription factor interactor and regulator CCHC(Zn) family [Lupinus albus]
MENRPDPDIDDDDFLDLYKEYTGPLGSAPTNTQEKAKSNKRSNAGSDEEEEESRDPNAVPTDFTSREAKVWEAKSKATERNWKKRKEEEMICKLCGESGHFTQGCPSTLGANRKSQDFFERIPARDKQLRALFTEKVITKIERDIGCKIKMDEKFIIVSGKDRLILAKGVDAVHKIREEGDQRGSSSSHIARSRSPERSPVNTRFQCSEPQRSHSGGPRNPSHFQQRLGRPERAVEDRVRDDLQKFSRGSPQAYGNSGARGRSSHSRSPRQTPYTGNAYNSFDGRDQSMGAYRNGGWDSHRRESGIQPGQQFDHNASSQTLEELELEYKKEASELMKIRDREEDEENFKHREAIRDLRENYMNKAAMLRVTHAKHWEEFLQVDSQRRELQAMQQISSGYGGYKHQNFPEYDDGSTVNTHYSGTNLPSESRNRFPDTMDTYPNRPHDNFGEFQRRGDFAKSYNRY